MNVYIHPTPPQPLFGSKKVTSNDSVSPFSSTSHLRPHPDHPGTLVRVPELGPEVMLCQHIAREASSHKPCVNIELGVKASIQVTRCPVEGWRSE